MIQVTPQMRILVAVEAVDFRKGIDGLARVCKAELSADPFSGCVFVFRNRKATAIKALVYDGQGFWFCVRSDCPRAVFVSGRKLREAHGHLRHTNSRCF